MKLLKEDKIGQDWRSMRTRVDAPVQSAVGFALAAAE